MGPGNGYEYRDYDIIFDMKGIFLTEGNFLTLEVLYGDNEGWILHTYFDNNLRIFIIILRKAILSTIPVEYAHLQ